MSGAVETGSVICCQLRLRSASAGCRANTSSRVLARSERTIAHAFTMQSLTGWTPQYPRSKKYKSVEQGGCASRKCALRPIHLGPSGTLMLGLNRDQRPAAIITHLAGMSAEAVVTTNGPSPVMSRTSQLERVLTPAPDSRPPKQEVHIVARNAESSGDYPSFDHTFAEKQSGAIDHRGVT